MIISCSRRTDIPAFYSEWFMDKLKKGCCVTVNPYNPNQQTHISLKPEDVDLFVFWTKNPAPFLKNLDILNNLGYKYYFQYTLNDYPSYLEPHLPIIENRIDSLIKLSNLIGKNKIIWRYDPIIFTDKLDYRYHMTRFTNLLEKLRLYIDMIVISIYDNYVSSDKRLEKYEIDVIKGLENTYEFKKLMNQISYFSAEKGLKVYSCAELLNLEPYGISPGKCIDGEYIEKTFNIESIKRKDKNQRKECGCIESKDIGAYNTCPHKCLYCYANKGDAGVDKNYALHKYESSSLK
jgi:DNA repair photolyase